MLHRIPTRFSLITAITYNFFEENVLEALKTYSKQMSTIIRQFLNLFGVMVYIIVEGPPKPLCHLLPYLKTKKNDLITTYAKR